MTTNNDDLMNAAKEVIKCWDSPNWKVQAPTALYIERLRAALQSPAVREATDAELECSVSTAIHQGENNAGMVARICGNLRANFKIIRGEK